MSIDNRFMTVIKKAGDSLSIKQSTLHFFGMMSLETWMSCSNMAVDSSLDRSHFGGFMFVKILLSSEAVERILLLETNMEESSGGDNTIIATPSPEAPANPKIATSPENGEKRTDR